MKRSLFHTPNYDPFAEVDFPDNDRRKKTKFGRGSGQWRFTDRTPSPNNEAETTTFDITSPSGLQGPDGATETRTTPPAETVLDDAMEDEQIARVAAREVANNVDAMSPSSPPNTSAGPAESEAFQEVVAMEQAPPAASPESIESSSTAPELDDESDVEDREESQSVESDDGIINGLAPDYGYDGSVFSRARQTLSGALDTAEDDEEIGELAHARQELETTLGPERSMSVESEADEGVHEARQIPSTIKESAHEFMIIDESDSDQDAQQMSSSPSTSSDHLEAEHPLNDSVSSEDEGSSKIEAPRLSTDEVLLLAERKPNSVEEKQVTISDLEILPAPGLPEQQVELSAKLTEVEQSKVEVIDLESEDGEDKEDSDKSRSSEAGLHESVSSEPGVTEPPLLERRFALITPLGTSSSDWRTTAESLRSSPPAPDGQKVAFRPGAADLLPSTKEETPGPQAPQVEIESGPNPSEELPATIRAVALSMSAPAAGDEKEVVIRPGAADRLPSTEEGTPSTQAPKVEVQRRSISPAELPSTIQETFDDPSTKSHLMTPSTTQQSSFVSQPSFTSVHTAPDEETLPTPRLTQGTSAGIVLPESRSLPASQGTSALEEEHLSVEKRSSTPQRAPNLIEKLKAMRKLSNQSSRRSSDTSATSPWFAPKGSGQIVPDSEAESEVDSLPGKEQSSQYTAASTGRTPEKKKTLADSFIRSTPQRTTFASVASSPAYMPPSQAPPPGFRTHLSYFVPLATLSAHFTTTVDILAIALSSTPVTCATSGPKDYNQTLYITDPSSHKLRSPLTKAQIFRSYNDCFPILEKGDAVLLRDFRVQSFRRRMTLLSTQSSSWAVFRKGAGVQMRGPPVELGAEERLFARGLWRWWDGLTNEEITTLEEAVSKESPRMTKDKDVALNGTIKITKNSEDGDQTHTKIKKEAIEGLGIDLPGSQRRARKPSLRARSAELDGLIDSDKVIESTEPSKRVLRPRGARGKPEQSESPTKVLNTRHGTVFMGGLGELDSD